MPRRGQRRRPTHPPAPSLAARRRCSRQRARAPGVRGAAANRRQPPAGEREGYTLQPTVLVHEAWMRLADQRAGWQNRSHFFAIAAQAMRRIVVDRARRRTAAKRGGHAEEVPLDEVAHALASPLPDDRLLLLDAALDRLATLDVRQARVVELRYFAGLSVVDTADALDVSTTTVKREWAAARAWPLNNLFI